MHRLYPEPDEENDTTKSIWSAVLGFLTEYQTYGNNRVTGILLGCRYNGYLIKNKLSMNISGGYAFQREKVEGELKLNLKLQDFFINNIEVQVLTDRNRGKCLHHTRNL